jgi:hypothetical protein
MMGHPSKMPKRVAAYLIAILIAWISSEREEDEQCWKKWGYG